MFEDLPRHTLIRKTDGGVFLIKCKVMEISGFETRSCYLGYLYLTEVDYLTSKCYTDQVDSIIKEF